MLTISSFVFISSVIFYNFLIPCDILSWLMSVFTEYVKISISYNIISMSHLLTVFVLDFPEPNNTSLKYCTENIHRPRFT